MASCRLPVEEEEEATFQLDHFQLCFYSPPAFCKNSVDGQWYCFDDSEVQTMAEEEVCQQTAYILFYQRRATIPSWSANSSVAGEPLYSLT